MTSTYRLSEKMSVTLILRPSAVIALIAGMPSAVAGIFTMRLRRATRSCKPRAAASVACVSCASSGATSIETNPSAPLLRSKTCPNTEHASSTSAMTSSQ
jgi:hypothetical protein